MFRQTEYFLRLNDISGDSSLCRTGVQIVPEMITTCKYVNYEKKKKKLANNLKIWKILRIHMVQEK